MVLRKLSVVVVVCCCFGENKMEEKRMKSDNYYNSNKNLALKVHKIEENRVKLE